jgi:hypothetical protein
LAIALGSKVSAARWAAFEILRRVEDGVFSSGLLATEEPKLEPSDRALCHELVLGVLRWQFYLDKIIEHYSNPKDNKSRQIGSDSFATWSLSTSLPYTRSRLCRSG